MTAHAEAVPRRAPPGRPIAQLAAAGLFLSAIWNLPVGLDDYRAPVLVAVSVELVVLLGLLALLPPLRTGLAGQVVRVVVAGLTAGLLTLKLAELIMRMSLGRPFNLLLDVQLAPSLAHLLTGTLGEVLGWLALAAAIVLIGLVSVLAFVAVAAIQSALARPPLPAVTLGLVGLVALVLGLQTAASDAPAGWRPASLHASATVAEQWRRGREMLAARERFEAAVAEDALASLPPERLLSGLRDVDVLQVYVESYGRSALEQDRYARVLGPRLDAFQQALDQAGLSAVSGYLTSPTVGGQSWLAHGTIQSGLWLTNQHDYDFLIQSQRLTLTKAFARAGHRTIAVKPAITMPWPEGQQFGYEQIYAAADLGYRGLPFNWVTMPDQYTLSVLQRRERQPDRAHPLHAEVSLISSHAPWTPIAPVLDDWQSIGDGEIFSRWANEGDPPEVVWRDSERVRRQYALALDYTLGVLASYARRFVDDRTLLIAVGDHQSAPLITGENATRDVPMHLISGDPALLAPFLDWGFTPGMRPDPAGPVHRMDAFRNRFLSSYSAPGAG